MNAVTLGYCDRCYSIKPGFVLRPIRINFGALGLCLRVLARVQTWCGHDGHNNIMIIGLNR